MLTSSKTLAERSDRMLDKLSARMHQTIGHRADMYIEDSEAIDRDSCRVMVAYAKHIGPVSSENLEEFIVRSFSGKLVPNMATAQSFSEMARVLVVLTRANVTRPMEDTKYMHSVAAGAVYIDKTLADTWEVSKTEAGQPFLRRVSSDDINQIVEVRRQRMSTAGQQPMTISAAMNMFGGTMHVGPGDLVKVVYKDSVHADCTVSSVGDDTITVKIPNVGSATMSKQAVVQIQQVSAKRLAEMEKKLHEYYSEVYGPEYSKMLTQDTTQG